MKHNCKKTKKRCHTQNQKPEKQDDATKDTQTDKIPPVDEINGTRRNQVKHTKDREITVEDEDTEEEFSDTGTELEIAKWKIGNWTMIYTITACDKCIEVRKKKCPLCNDNFHMCVGTTCITT